MRSLILIAIMEIIRTNFLMIIIVICNDLENIELKLNKANVL